VGVGFGGGEESEVSLLDVALRLSPVCWKWVSLISCYSQAEAALALWLAPLGA
jgi:hypothetical protein